MTEYIGTDQLVSAAHITRRQAEYWFNKGHLKSIEAFPGSGNDREIPADQISVARMIKRLLEAGIKLDIAAWLANGTELERSEFIRRIAAIAQVNSR